MAFARISFILPSNEALGPLHISLGRTINELYKWFFLFLMIFLAFLLGLFKLYSNYGGEELGLTVCHQGSTDRRRSHFLEVLTFSKLWKRLKQTDWRIILIFWPWRKLSSLYFGRCLDCLTMREWNYQATQVRISSRIYLQPKQLPTYIT